MLSNTESEVKLAMGEIGGRWRAVAAFLETYNFNSWMALARGELQVKDMSQRGSKFEPEDETCTPPGGPPGKRESVKREQERRQREESWMVK